MLVFLHIFQKMWSIFQVCKTKTIPVFKMKKLRLREVDTMQRQTISQTLNDLPKVTHIVSVSFGAQSYTKAFYTYWWYLLKWESWDLLERGIDQESRYLEVVLFCFELGSYVAQSCLKLNILLPLPSECWDYRCAPPHLLIISSVTLYLFFFSLKGSLNFYGPHFVYLWNVHICSFKAQF
jgi:hypothetical protein